MAAGHVFAHHPTPPKPKPFHMTELFKERDVWCFWLAAEEPVLQFVQNLHCVLSSASRSPFFQRPQGRILVTINPRYEAQEVWRWLVEVLEAETQEVELSEPWEEAITTAFEYEDDGY